MNEFWPMLVVSLVWHGIAWPVAVVALPLIWAAIRAGLFSSDPDEWTYR